jgi:pimeloyl-ACP methyl ester carboxylesterase
MIPEPRDPISIRSVETKHGGSVHLYDYGGLGRPILFVHGAFGTGRLWDFVASSLQSELHPFSVDLIGHGKSDWGMTSDRYQFSYLVDDLLACLDLVDEQSIHQPVIIGHSIGSALSMMLASAYPDRINAAAFLDIDPCPPLHQAEHLNNVGAREPRVFSGRAELMKAASKTAPEASVRVREHLSDHGYRSVEKGFQQRFDQRFLKSIQSWDLTDSLSKISVPVLVLRGQNSTVMTDNGVNDLCSEIKEVTFKVVPSSTHQLHLERPSEVARLISSFCSNT